MYRIAVIGAGQMGAGIAQVAAHAGHTVLLNDRSQALYERGRTAIEKNLARSLEKAKITAAQRDATLANITFAPEIAKLDVDLAIEAASEDLGIKLDIFRALDIATPPEAILASNTSSISITTLGATNRPQDIDRRRGRRRPANRTHPGRPHEGSGDMMAPVRTRLILGVLLCLIGVAWLGQGVGLIGGSFMTGQALWAVIGLVALAFGAALVASAKRKPSGSNS